MLIYLKGGFILYIDARVIKLGKLFVPKTKSYSEFNKEKNNLNCGRYVSTGYFNYISIYNIKDDNGNAFSSLFEVHQRSEEIINVPENDECSYQFVKVFTNVNNDESGYTKKEISDFWADEKLMIFVSMIHIGNNNLSDIVNSIHENFKDVSNNYLVYFTFDYSDIIIFLKSDRITDYMDRISNLNYNLEQKLIEDSYTIYGYSADVYEKLYKENCNKKFDLISWGNYFKKEEEFFASINIGIESKNKLNELIKDAKKDHRSVKIYRMYGRHDISIVNHKANSKWLLYILMRLDYLSSREENNNDENGMILYETFIKTELPSQKNSYNCISYQSEKEKFYNKVKEKLNNEFEGLQSLLQRNKKFLRYQYPVQEIKNSVLSIVKNNFAEEFVLSMFESFVILMQHMKYMIENMENGKKKEYVFNKFVNDYFNALNCLVSTVMHNDRQFIQATSFNAIFFDVPPKLVSYYSSLMHQFKTLMKNKDEKKYAFIFAPNLEPGITLRSLSKENPPVDRIIAISITEESMYNFKSVFRRLAHETAHYAGDGFRFRDVRKERLISTFLYLVLYEYKNIVVNDELYSTITEIKDQIKKEGLIDFKYNYSVSFEEMEVILKSSLVYAETKECAEKIHDIISENLENYFNYCLTKDEKFRKKLLNDFYNEYLNNISQKGIIGKKYRDSSAFLYKQVAKYNTKRFFETYDTMILNDGNDEFDDIHDVFKTFIDIYIEVFADLQSVIILNLSFQDYLNCFINEEDFDVSNIKNNLLDLGRIVIVTKLFFSINVWNDFDSNSICFLNSDKIAILRNIVLNNLKYLDGVDRQSEEKTQHVKELINDCVFIESQEVNMYKTDVIDKGEVDIEELFYPFTLLYDYLITCLEECMTIYNSDDNKKDLIIKLQAQYKEFTSFNDIQKILDFINESNRDYKLKLFDI